MIALAQLLHDRCIAEAEADEASARACRLTAHIALHPDNKEPYPADKIIAAEISASYAEKATARALTWRLQASIYLKQAV